MVHRINFKNLMFYIGEYAKKVGRVAARPVLLTYFVMMDDKTTSNRFAFGKTFSDYRLVGRNNVFERSL